MAWFLKGISAMISCSHSEPSGALSTSVGNIGAMKAFWTAAQGI